MDHLKITSDLLSADEVCSVVKDESCGAVSLFIGTTRDNFDGKKVLQLEYEAYEGMAIKSMKAICNEIRSKWSNVHSIAIYHRTGVVPVKEASVIIAVSSPHRQASLEAVAYCIDQLKATVPIWKKEIYEGEDRGVKEMDDEEMREISVEDYEQSLVENESNRPTIDKNRTENRPAIDEKRNIDKSLIQVNVSSEELERRMSNFINRKRDQVNMHNIKDFIPNRQDDEVESCARVRTLFVKRSDSKGHLKVRRVYNEWGPQTAKINTKQMKTEPESYDPTLPIGVAERVASIEKYLNVTPVSSDIYKRLKAMEEKIADLESLSPEYANFWKYASSSEEVVHREHQELIYDVDDIDQKIEELERELV